MKKILLAALLCCLNASAAEFGYHGKTLGYPKFVSQRELKEAIPDFACNRTEKNVTACSTRVHMMQTMLIAGYEPFVCMMGGEASVTFFRDTLVSLSCDVDHHTWSSLMIDLKSKFGRPKVTEDRLGAIQLSVYEWRDGTDTISLLMRSQTLAEEFKDGKKKLITRIALSPFIGR